MKEAKNVYVQYFEAILININEILTTYLIDTFEIIFMTSLTMIDL